MVDTTVIFAIIIANVVALAVVALVILLFYYHWRNQELLVNFSAFIRENLKLKDEIGKLQEGNKELKEQRDRRDNIYKKVSV
jgi:ABC-type siderophore export system fused ATPase/permease subunit